MEDGKSLTEQIEALQKALDASKHSFKSGAALKTDDQMETAKKYLTAGALADLSRKSMTLSVKKDDGSFAFAVYFGVRVRSENIESGVEKISKIINELSADGLIHSTLAPMVSLDFARMPLQTQTSAVLSYVLVPSEKHEEIKKRYAHASIEEGGAPPDGEDLRPTLADGEFLADVRVSSVASLVSGQGNNPTAILQAQIEQYLALLPKGTKVKEVVPCAITDLSVPYEVKFYNPLMKRFKYVDLDYVRAVEVVGEKLEQFNLLLGIRYMDADRKPLFQR